MPVKKQFIKAKPVCKVTFSFPTKTAQQVAVVGDFNNCDPSAGALSKLKNGTFKGVFDLDKNADYEFKYLVDGSYINEPEADAYRWNAFAGNENSVVVV